MRNEYQTNAGFTLIELSIVLVIIGLLVGGILVGRDLIHSAELRGTLTQLEQYKAAVNTFKIKFNCLPGDCLTASDFGLGANGNGDGFVGEFCDVVSVDCPGYPANVYGPDSFVPNESVTFWAELATVGLVALPQNQLTYYPQPQTKMGHGSWEIQKSDLPTGGNAFKIVEEYNGNYTTAQTMCGSETNCQSLSPSDVYYFDKKIDDGFPGTGKIVVTNAFTYPGETWQGGAALVSAGAPGASSAVCVNNGVTPNQYNVQNVTPNLCLPEFSADF